MYGVSFSSRVSEGGGIGKDNGKVIGDGGRDDGDGGRGRGRVDGGKGKFKVIKGEERSTWYVGGFTKLSSHQMEQLNVTNLDL